ncbi:MAG: trypsin-like peptidase domain-containing protein [Candidatus Niyogibacteria bacterium]|nr:MAG: trypsin-like peptidase domain-containing protein [Candidatus Niyogibacteria bacterium]
MNKRFSVVLASLLVISGCTGARSTTTPTSSPPLLFMHDGQYDYNTFLVNPRRMNLTRIIESLYSLRTEVKFRGEEGKVLNRSLRGTGIALFGKYLLTVEHVVSVENAAITTPLGEVALRATKVDERTYLEHGGRSYALERLVADKNVDVALFRIPAELRLKSFPYRIGNSDDLQVGNFVYLIGNPMNFGVNVREGIVSSLRAPQAVSLVNSVARNAFMVSNGLNPGDSGAPVIAIRDGDYELVGLSQGSFTKAQRLGWVIMMEVIKNRLAQQGFRLQ